MHRPSIVQCLGLTVLLLTAAQHRVALAQAPDSLRTGDRVQVRIVGPDAAATDLRCIAFVAAAQRDTLLLERSESCPHGTYLADLRVARGAGGSRLGNTVLGALVGAVAGGVIARGSGDGVCSLGPCSPDGSTSARTATGVVAGALLGAVIGAVLPINARWVEAGKARPVVVGALTLHPGLKVSVRSPPAH